ncbi:MAG: hypothetical protein SX243_07505 [Acidobacteriota bacterium]|nr:hypothetical protein [Acidobacteriota bacterium]
MSADGCLKGGCIGCVVAAALLGAAAVVVGLVISSADPPEPEPVSRRMAQPLPEAPAAPSAPEAPASMPAEAPPGAPSSTTGSSQDGPQAVELGSASWTSAAAEGIVRVNVDAGSLRLEVGEPNQEIELFADYDEARFRVEESLHQIEGEPWLYRLRVDGKGGVFGLPWQGGRAPELRLVLPRDRALALEISLGAGESRFDLGGLWLTDVEMDLGPGDHWVSVLEPLAEPLPRLEVDASWGSIKTFSLGNASPVYTNLRTSGGELVVDLGGAWRGDGEVDLRFGFGSCLIVLPDNARTEVLRANVQFGEKLLEGSTLEDSSLAEDAPTVGLKVSGTAGELTLKR